MKESMSRLHKKYSQEFKIIPYQESTKHEEKINEIIKSNRYHVFSYVEQQSNVYKISNYEWFVAIDKLANKKIIEEIFYYLKTNGVLSSCITNINGKRLIDNVIFFNSISIDVDDGLTSDEITNILNVENVNHIRFTSKSHQVEKNGITCDREHIFIFTEGTTDIKIQRKNTEYWCNIMSGDRAAVDAVRLLGPNLTGNMKMIYSNEKMDYEYKKTIRTIDDEKYEKVKKEKETEKIVDDKIFENSEFKMKSFMRSLEIQHPKLRPAKYHASNSSFNFWRDSNDQGPGLFALKEKYMVTDPSKNINYPLFFSYKDFLEIEEINKNKIKDELSNALRALREHFILHGNKSEQIVIVKTAEGTGKSCTINDQVQPSDFLTYSTKKKMLEEIEFLKKRGYENIYVVLSKGDLIFTGILENYGETEEAHEKANIVLEKFNSTFSKQYYYDDMSNKEKDDAENLTNLIKATEIKNLCEEIDNELNCIDSITKEREKKFGVAFMSFLESMIDDEILTKECVEFIFSLYLEQIRRLANKKDIFVCTTDKFAVICKENTGFINSQMVFMDEYKSSVFNFGEVVQAGDKMYNFFCKLATVIQKIKEEKMSLKIIKESLNIKNYQKLKDYIDKNNIRDIIVGNSCWGQTAQQIHILRDVDFYKKKNLQLVINTTEILPTYAFANDNEKENLVVIDLTQKIYEKKLAIIPLQGLNKTMDPKNLFVGSQRLLMIKSYLMNKCGVKEKYIIGNGLGHSVQNNLHNLMNSRGTNSIRDDLEKEEEAQTVAVIVTCPNPQEIMSKKAEMQQFIKLTAKEDSINFKEFYESNVVNEFIKNLLICDATNQALGRCLGNRATDKVKKVYLIINESLKECFKNNMRYITPYIFSLSSFTHDIMKNKYPETYKIVSDMHEILHAKADENLDLKVETHRKRKDNDGNDKFISQKDYNQKNVDCLVDIFKLTKDMKQSYFVSLFLDVVKNSIKIVNNKIKQNTNIICEMTRIKINKLKDILLKIYQKTSNSVVCVQYCTEVNITTLFKVGIFEFLSLKGYNLKMIHAKYRRNIEGLIDYLNSYNKITA